MAAALREIVAGRNWRNLPLMLALLLLIGANVLMHLEVAGLADTAATGERLGIAVLAMLIGLIGGRVIPSFRSEEHTSELQSLMRISYAVFCLKKKKITHKMKYTNHKLTHHNSTEL